jgi:nitrite reductase (NADH) large subunit
MRSISPKQITRYLIVGNGAAGVTAAETIRRHDQIGHITIVGAEPYAAYSRPGLAYVLVNEIPKRQVIARSLDWYGQQSIELVHGTAKRIDIIQHRVVLGGGTALPYDRLLIATGARATPAPYPGGELRGVVYLDTMASTEEILRLAKRRRRAVVIGGGITALELCEGLVHRGVRTHYFLRRDRLWSRVFNQNEARLLETRMRSHGVTIHYNTEIAAILGKRGKVRGVRLTNGEEFACDLVGVAIGVRPQLELVQNSAVQFDRGILVDEFMQSNVPHIYAAGDVAQVYDRWTDKHMLDILWPSAVAEGEIAGLNMVGHKKAYVKDVPFNACLLFGLHITTMGQINPRPPEGDSGVVEISEELSRGSSEVWYTYPRHYNSAYSEDGPNTMRLVLNGHDVVGALIIGNQSLAEPLRHLIEDRVDVSDIMPKLRKGGSELKRELHRYIEQMALA